MLRQWQPETVRRLTVKGLIPAVIGAPGTVARNFTQWQNTVPPKNVPYGGSFALFRFSLGSLYEDYLLLRNYWSRSNTQLDLIRYLGCRFRLYRHETKDYIFSYTLETPMDVSIETNPHNHPARSILRKRHVTVPSLHTNQSRRRYRTVKIKPPRLFKNNWYFQKDLCNVGLVMTSITTCNLQHPWLRPSAKTPCLTIYAITQSDKVYKTLSVTADQAALKQVQKKLRGTLELHLQ